MAQQVLDAHDVKTFLKKVCRIGVPQGMDCHFLGDSGLLFDLLYGPLHSPLGIPAVKISTGTAGNLLILSVEEPDGGLFGLDVGFQSPDQVGKALEALG